MRKILAILFLIISILFPLSAQASMLMPSGGWLIDSATRVRTYTNYTDIYRMSAEKIVGYDREGSPLVETITFVDAPFDPKSTALGFRHCKATPENNGIVAVYSMAQEAVKYSWVFDGKKFKNISTKDVICDKHLLLD